MVELNHHYGSLTPRLRAGCVFFDAQLKAPTQPPLIQQHFM